MNLRVLQSRRLNPGKRSRLCMCIRFCGSVMAVSRIHFYFLGVLSHEPR